MKRRSIEQSGLISAHGSNILPKCKRVNDTFTLLLTMHDRSSIMVSMNRLDSTRRAQVIRCLVEGNSIRATVRITGVAKNTVAKLLVEAGYACAEFQDKAFRELTLKRIQCDEIWSFCYAKDKNLPTDKQEIFGYGSVWTWTAIDAETKLVPCWMVGPRDADSANMFMTDLASRLATRVQLTTDGFKPYLEAVEGAFGASIDYAMLVKLYGEDLQGDTRYSPAVCNGTKKADCFRITRAEAYQHQLRRAPEPHDAYAHAPVHSADECVLEEVGEPHCGNFAALHVLQLLPHPSITSRDPGDGCKRHGSRLGC